MKRLALIGFWLCALPASADNLGRLFTSPEQRATLAQGLPSAAPGALLPPHSEKVELQGIIKKRGGSEIVWVNGHTVTKGHAVGGMRLINVDRARATVLPPDTRDPITLKPGQTWEGAAVKETVVDPRRGAIRP